jgi:hypothetical protein
MNEISEFLKTKEGRDLIWLAVSYVMVHIIASPSMSGIESELRKIRQALEEIGKK